MSDRASKMLPWIALTVAAAYFVFLIATWMQFQNDRALKESQINELLDRFPKKHDKGLIENEPN